MCDIYFLQTEIAVFISTADIFYRGRNVSPNNNRGILSCPSRIIRVGAFLWGI
jgi:hypothetical protein